MNMIRDGRPNEVFSTVGAGASTFLQTTHVTEPMPSDRARGRRVTYTGHADSWADVSRVNFGQFAFKALPVFERGGLWLSAHLDVAGKAFGEAWRVYDASFSDCEKRAYFEQVAILRHSRYRFSAIGFGDEVVGVLGCWDLPGFRFIEHLAVSAVHRSAGFGGRAVSLLQQHLGGVIALDVEPPTAGAVAARRVAFYERNGFRFDAEPMKLPPYVGKGTGPSHLMTWSYGASAPERDAVLAAISSEVYGAAVGMPRS